MSMANFDGAEPVFVSAALLKERGLQVCCEDELTEPQVDRVAVLLDPLG